MATAKLNREYAMRMGGVGAMLVAFAAWSVYDGAVAWPRANADLAKARPALEARAVGRIMTPEDWLASQDGQPESFPLKEVFEKEGIPLSRKLVMELSEITHPAGDSPDARRARAEAAADLFSRDLYPAGKCKGQFVQAAVLAFLALLALRAVWSKRGIEYVADDAGLRGSGFGGGEIAWDMVSGVDWRRWESKGIVAVRTKDGRSHAIDGWHFKGVRDIAEVLEKRFPQTAKAETAPKGAEA